MRACDFNRDEARPDGNRPRALGWPGLYCVSREIAICASERTNGFGSLAAAVCSAGPATLTGAAMEPSDPPAFLRTATSGSEASACTRALAAARVCIMPMVVAASARTPGIGVLHERHGDHT